MVATPGPEPIGEAEFSGKGVGEILIVPGSPDTMYVASTTALRGMSSVCCSGVTRPVPGAAKWGSTRRPTVVTPGRSSTTARPTSPTASAPFPSSTTRSPARPVACGTSLSTRTTPTRSTRLRTRVASGAQRMPGHLDADQAVAERGGDPDACRDRGHGAAERRNADVHP